jgi:hypothetical protein
MNRNHGPRVYLQTAPGEEPTAEMLLTAAIADAALTARQREQVVQLRCGEIPETIDLKLVTEGVIPPQIEGWDRRPVEPSDALRAVQSEET